MKADLLFATTNPGKQQEIRSLLEDLEVRLLFLQDLAPVPELDETGTTFEENARIKAAAYRGLLPGGYVAAEDSGLVVPALGGEPGVYSARYGGRPDDASRNAYLLERMRDLQGDDRSAYYEAAVVLLCPGGAEEVFTGRVERGDRHAARRHGRLRLRSPLLPPGPGPHLRQRHARREGPPEPPRQGRPRPAGVPRGEAPVRAALGDFEKHLATSGGSRTTPSGTTCRTWSSSCRSSRRPCPASGGPTRWTPSPCRTYLGYLHQKGISKASVMRKLAALRAFFRFLHREGRVASNPAQAPHTPRQIKKVPRVLSEAESVALVEAPPSPEDHSLAGLRDRALLELLYATGMRASEVVGLDMERLLLTDRIIRVWGKGRKERVVPFGEPAARAVEAYLAAAPRRGRPAGPRAPSSATSKGDGSRAAPSSASWRNI